MTAQTAAQNKKFGLLAIDDNESTCEVCGRTDLKRVMWIIELDIDGAKIGNAIHCGTTCGARMIGQTHGKINTAVKNFESEVEKARRIIRDEIERDMGAEEILKGWSRDGLNFRERRNSPEWETLMQIQKFARSVADSREIIIKLPS